MKKPFITLTFIFLAGWVGAQAEFAPVGATWHFDYYLFVAVVGYEKITVEKDTVLFGKQAKKLALERVTKIYPSNDLYFFHEVHFLHQTGDTIWHFDPNTSNQNDFHILFDFSLMPGDTLFYDDFGYHYLVIDSVGTIELNGGQYPVQYGSTPFSPVNQHEKVIISEKTGTLNTYLFIDTPDLCFLDGDCHYLRCYEDLDFPLLQLSDEDCEFLITSTAEVPQQSTLVISPNPTSDYLNFYLRTPIVAREASFRIINAAGIVVQEFKSDSPEATYIEPLWNLAAGVYFLQYLENGLVRHAEKFIKL